MNYSEAYSIFLKAKSKIRGKPVENNTRLRMSEPRYGCNIYLVLHRTSVVIFHDDGSYSLSSGGWRTRTTKERINAYLPLGMRVVQRGTCTSTAQKLNFTTACASTVKA